ncbi:GH25 family lysozyme [Arthrobacter sp. B3I9]|uniref:GH25 family lysozyme n=1 Tax=Arthrobacter sp. B3I9 TaxID=3042270 RepID=UPI00358E0758
MTPAPQTAKPAPASPQAAFAAPQATAPVDPSTEAGKAAMAQAIGPGGAEMGQRSPRVSGGKAAATQALTTQGTWTPTFGVQGLDVSGHQPNVDWQAQWNGGARFAYIKASEGDYYTNPSFGSQYEGSRSVGMIRGAYHFAIPNWSSGADQARYFVQNGGGWSADGVTMPPVLDFEFNPYAGRTIGGFYFGNTCYDMSAGQLASWVRDFGNTMQSLTGRLPVIYTNTSWWNQCLGNPSGFGDYPLWVASYPDSFSNDAGDLPTRSWSIYSIWQYSSTGPYAGDSNVWNGSYADLGAFARNGVSNPAFQAMGNLASSTPSLGAQTSGVTCGLRDGGCYQAYQNGEILYSPASGAQPTTAGAIRTAYRNAGAENSALGYPTSAELCGIRNAGCYQTYQHGEILWSPATGARISRSGGIRTLYRNNGAENGLLGYPTTDEICGLVNGGCYQAYQNGEILWSPATGARISRSGGIRTLYRNNGAENGLLGYPTTDEICGLTKGGCYQNYQNGAIIWSPTTGAQLSPKGPIRTLWQQNRFETGPLAYPTSAVVCGLTKGGCYQNYQNGAIIWSPTTGAQLSPNGPIRTLWQQNRFETGPLAYPTSAVVCGLTKGGCYQNYQNGAIIWSPTTGAQLSPNGPIRTLWQQNRFETGPLGYPTGPQTCNTTGTSCTQPFTGGKITWTPTRGAYID